MAIVIGLTYYKTIKLVHLGSLIWQIRIYSWSFQYQGISFLDHQLHSTRVKWFDTGVCIFFGIVHMLVLQNFYRRYAYEMMLINLVVFALSGYTRISNFNNQADVSILIIFGGTFAFVVFLMVMIYFWIQMDNHNSK